MAAGKYWWAHYTVGGRRYKPLKKNVTYEVSSVSKFYKHYLFKNQTLIGMCFPKALYPTIKHLPSERRTIDVFADLRT